MEVSSGFRRDLSSLQILGLKISNGELVRTFYVLIVMISESFSYHINYDLM